jgi:hypothetical protein
MYNEIRTISIKQGSSSEAVIRFANKFFAFHGTRRYIITFTCARYWLLSYVRLIEFTYL